VVRFVRTLSALLDCKVTVVRGNHEEKLLRFLSKPDKAPDYIKELIEQLHDGDREFLKQTIHFCPVQNGVVVHGGILPDTNLEEPQSKKEKKELDKIMRARYIRGRDRIQREVRIYEPERGSCIEKIKLQEGDPMPEIPAGHTHKVKEKTLEKGKFLALGENQEGDPFWADAYDGRFGKVFYGHEPYKHLEQPKQHKHAVGLDLGCVFGGHLCAVVLENGQEQVITVKEHQKHCDHLGE